MPQIVPFTPQLGILEWLNHTKPLKICIEENIKDDGQGKIRIKACMDEYLRWVGQYKGILDIDNAY